MRANDKLVSFRNEKLTYVDMKSIDLDHMLINLFMRLDRQGDLVTVKKQTVTDRDLLEEVARRQDALQHFVADEELSSVTKRWLESDLMNIVRQKHRKGTIASPRPLHLRSYLWRNSAQTRDYGSSQQIYAMLHHTDRELINELNDFLGTTPEQQQRRRNPESLDIGALALYYLSESRSAAPVRSENYERPLFPTAAALMCDDLRRLLAYRGRMPRQAMIDYLRLLLGFHLGLYILRLIHWLPSWIEQAEADPTQAEICMVVDLGESPNRHMAELARQSMRYYEDRRPMYVRATVAFSLLENYAKGYKKLANPSIPTIIGLLKERDSSMFQGFFMGIAPTLIEDRNEQNEDDGHFEVLSDKFEEVLETLTSARLTYQRDFITRVLNSLLQKNTDSGLIWQGLGRWPTARPRFYMGSRLLEALAQLAVLHFRNGYSKSFESRPILIDEFIDWLEMRYGILLNPLHRPGGPTSGDDYPAYRDNLDALKQRLRRIGFYTDLSDAYNAQTIHPRYMLT